METLEVVKNQKTKTQGAEEKALRDLKARVSDVFQRASQGPVAAETLSQAIDMAESFDLVSRAGMASGLHYPLHEKRYRDNNAMLKSGVSLPVLRHILNETSRAINIVHRGGYKPRDYGSPLYGRATPRDWAPRYR